MRGFSVFRSLVLTAMAAGCLAACAADVGTDPGSVDSDNEEIRIGTGYRYDCTRWVANPAHVEHISVALTSKVSKLTFVWTFDDGRTRVAHFAYDASYAPKTNTSYSRYFHLDGAGSPDTILTYTPMRTGAKSGSVKLQWGGDSFSTAYYHCARTTSVINTGEPAPRAPSSTVTAALGSGNFYADPPSGESPADMVHHVYSLMLSPDGRYVAYNTDASTEMGVWKTEDTKLPLSIAFQSGTYKWTGVATNGKVVWTRGSQKGTLTLAP